MPRPRKNLVLLEMSGATKTNPGRYKDRVELETPGPIGDPPESLTRPSSDRDRLIARWHLLVSIAPVGLLTASDRESLAVLCRQGIESERTGAKGYQRALKDYLAGLKAFGMTPDGRAARGLGGKVTTKTVANPLDAFLKPRKKQVA